MVYFSETWLFVLVYGRRCVGKTYFINELFRDRFTFIHKLCRRLRLSSAVPSYHGSRPRCWAVKVDSRNCLSRWWKTTSSVSPGVSGKRRIMPGSVWQILSAYLYENSTNDGEFWQHNHNSPSVNSWRGFAFENECFEHVLQIKFALWISGVHKLIYWLKGKDNQIDFQIVKDDRIVGNDDIHNNIWSETERIFR